jgi:exopolysaccharide biosynthesis polyprenyl glycosylphosphotransferase
MGVFLKGKAIVFKRLHFIADLALTALALNLAIRLDCFVKGNYSDIFRNLEHLLLLVLPIWSIFLLSCGECYEYRLRSFGQIIKNIGLVMLKSTGLLLALLFVTKSTIHSRLLLGGLAVFDFVLLLGVRVLISAALNYLRKQGYNLKTILIVGSGQIASDFIQQVRKNSQWGFGLLGVIDWEDERKGKNVLGVPIIGNLDELPNLVKNGYIDYVVYAVPRRYLNLVEKSMLACEEMGVTVCVLADFFPLKLSKKKVTQFIDKPMILFTTTPDKYWSMFFKYLLDRIIALAGLALVSPIMLGTAILIKITSKGPVLFKQQRCGLNGRKFTLYKFRTMVDNAEDLKASLSNMNEMDGPMFKITNDPRLTRVGKNLRKYSVDELPQLLNVLFGDMSLVGPRPPLPSEVSQFDHWQRRKLSMKPGITCLWQINGRNNVNFEEWMKLDLKYIDNWSLWLDTKILLKTIPAVMKGTGAK